jgi:hypothetical protein
MPAYPIIMGKLTEKTLDKAAESINCYKKTAEGHLQ